jgi:hypothetical protein
MLDQLEKLGRLENGERPVVIVTHNGWRMNRETELGKLLVEIEKEIESGYGGDDPLADPPAAPKVLISGGAGDWVTDAFIEQARMIGRRVARLLVPHPGQFAPLVIGCPGFGQVQGAVDDGVPAAGGKGEVDGDLAQADPAQGAGVLGCGAAAPAEDFASPVSSAISTASPSPGCVTAQAAVASITGRSSQKACKSRCCSRCGALWPIASAGRPAVHFLQFHQ